MSPRRARRRSIASRQRSVVLGLGVLVSAACSFSTDGIRFVPDDEFDALAGGSSRAGSGGSGESGGSAGKNTAGARSGGTSADAGSDSGGEAGEDGSGGIAGLSAAGMAGLSAGGKAGFGGGGAGAAAGSGAGGKGGALNSAGANTGGSVVGVGGRPNTAGAPGNGGSGGNGPSGMTYPCKGELPGDKLIADFKGIVQLGQEWKGGQTGATRFSVFGSPDPANGKPNVKLGADDLTVEVSGVLSPVGAGIRISPCINLKEAQSIGFVISGSTKQGVLPMIALRVYTNQNMLANDMTREGMCVPPVGQDPIQFCQPAHVDFELPTTPTLVEFRFADFKGGKPSDSLQLDQIKMIEWVFTSGMAQKPYDGYCTIDDVALSY